MYDGPTYPRDYVCGNCGLKVDYYSECRCVKHCSVCDSPYYDPEDAAACCAMDATPAEIARCQSVQSIFF
jgi:hypothetical protein